MNRKNISIVISLILLGLIFIQISAITKTFYSNGLIKIKSHYSVNETINRLEKILTRKGMTIFIRINHSAGAKKVGIKLRPTELLIFGNPMVGTHFFTSKQTAGIDLPMKALAWRDEKGQVWLTYNDPDYIAKRHGIKDRENVVKKMSGVLEKMSAIAIGN